MEAQAPPLPKSPASLEAIAAVTPGATVKGNGAISVINLAHPRMITASEEMVLILEAGALQLVQQSPVKVKAAVVASEIEVPSGLFEG